MIYITEPFRYNNESNTHQNKWQVTKLAKIIGEFGYNVDVIQAFDLKVKLRQKYDLIIDILPGYYNVYNDFMNEKCLKVAYLTGSNSSFANQAEKQRIENLYERKGVKLKPRRQAPLPNKTEFESFDAIFFIGNYYNLKTYEEFDIPQYYFIKNTGYDFLGNYNFSLKKSNNFLFFASSGQVHKGLDLLLDVFSRNPNLNLYICSSFKNEKDFCRLYKKALYNSKNVFPVGFVDITGSEFKKISAICSFIVLPSCSEANAGSVLTAMSAGLIPIVSKECGFEEDEVFYFNNCSIECIEDTILFFSKKDINWIKQNALETMDKCNSRYSKKNFTKSVRLAMNGVLQNSNSKCRI